MQVPKPDGNGSDEKFYRPEGEKIEIKGNGHADRLLGAVHQDGIGGACQEGVSSGW